MKTISIVTPCYNEEANAERIYERVRELMSQFPQYRREHVFIDNASTDRTPDILRHLASQDPYVKVIFNARNFGSIRSPYYGFTQATGDAVILMAADFQEPPDLIPEFIRCWEQGAKMALGVRRSSEESRLVYQLRKLYYRLVNEMSDIELIKNFNGFGLYDRQMVELFKLFKNPYPYMRGMVCEIGFDKALVEFDQPLRKGGKSKMNLLSLYDWAMLGLTSHTKMPIRLATMGGFALSILSLVVAFVYLLAKLFFWNAFPMGAAPTVLGIFLFGSVQLLFIGLLGEYILSIHTLVKNNPLVIEKERLNF
jgi:glycosyltransferase involved in cell wall biosynthesis